MAETNHPAAPTTSVPARRVLFLCTHNSARSQIAEGLARSVAPEGAEVWSAGTTPGGVHPLAVEVMKEIGIDISGQRSKNLDETPWRQVDTIVTLCAEADEACPAVAGSVRRLHWPLPDPGRAPESERLEAFRAARDELKWRVSSLWPGGD